MRRLFAIALVSLLFWSPLAAEPLHGIAMHGDVSLPRDYAHFPYVNPDVKKGGRITYGVVGTFDNLNPFILKSMRTTARGMWDPQFGNMMFESLMTRSADEPFSLYGLLAETVEWDEARSFIQFNLDPRAHWSDGKPVTPEDVIFTFELLRDKGRTPFSRRMEAVDKLEKVGERSVRFTFNDKADRETPLIIAAYTPVLPKHATVPESFEQSTLAPPIGSGPYRIKSINPGERIVYRRDPNYWGKDIPSKVGFDNYDEIAVEYFLQESTLFEAFKKGEVDIYPEGNPSHWDRAYDFPAVASGKVIKDVFKPKLPTGMLGFVFNTRRPYFADARLRKGLSLVFDFEWANRNLFENAYTRTQSYWQNSDLSSLGVPVSPLEREMMGDITARIDPAVLDGSYRLPVTDGSGRDRKVLKQAVDLLKQAGYSIRGGQMVDAKGTPLAFEIMTQNADQEKLALAYQRSLRALGIALTVRTVDDSQYQNRTIAFNFDMVMKSFTSSLSPGIEQVSRWGSLARDRQGSENYAGTADPDIDRLINNMLTARTAESFQAAVRSFDRMLISGSYFVPLYHLGEQWIARHKTIGRPDTLPLYGYQLQTWWDARAQ